MATLTSKSTQDLIDSCMAVAAPAIQLRARHVWIDYDEEADVLYMSFRKPQRATRTIEAGDDILIRKDGARVVGMTILNVSARIATSR